MSKAKVNRTVKAFRKALNKLNKFEYELTFANNPKSQHVYSGQDIRDMYRRVYSGYESDNIFTGWSKCGHVLDHIVVKRHVTDDDHVPGLKNQLLEEIRCWEALANTEDADCLCPMLRWHAFRGDRVGDIDPRQLEECVIIAQKAIFVSNAKEACKEAERLNKKHGYFDPWTWESRYERLEKLSNKMEWWDALGNGGNSGVIFDYQCMMYKAVIIDYAL